MKHAWAKIEITPILVLADARGGDPVVIVDPDAQAEATVMSQYGCLTCDVVLDRDTVDSECPGREDEDDSVNQAEGSPFDINRRHWDQN